MRRKVSTEVSKISIVITGARGRLGGELRRYLEGAGCSVIALSREDGDDYRSLRALGEILDEESCDAILHLAWSTLPSSAELSPGVEWHEDLPLLERILHDLDSRRRKDVLVPRLVFFSSCAVYGEPIQDGGMLDESCPPRPIGWYARGKVCAEQLISEFVRQGNSATVLRVTNPYGFYQGAQCLQGVIPAVIRASLEGRVFDVWGDGKAIKDYLHISDLCSAVSCIIQEEVSGVYNVASGHSVSLQDLIAIVQNLTGRPIQVRYKARCPWDVHRGRYSIDALAKATGWRPGVELSKGLADFIRQLQ